MPTPGARRPYHRSTADAQRFQVVLVAVALVAAAGSLGATALGVPQRLDDYGVQAWFVGLPLVVCGALAPLERAADAAVERGWPEALALLAVLLHDRATRHRAASVAQAVAEAVYAGHPAPIAGWACREALGVLHGLRRP